MCGAGLHSLESSTCSEHARLVLEPETAVDVPSSPEPPFPLKWLANPTKKWELVSYSEPESHAPCACSGGAQPLHTRVVGALRTTGVVSPPLRKLLRQSCTFPRVP